MNQVPSTIEEVRKIAEEITSGAPESVTALMGIFRVRMLMGDSLEQACIEMLKHYLKAAEARNRH